MAVTLVRDHIGLNMLEFINKLKMAADVILHQINVIIAQTLNAKLKTADTHGEDGLAVLVATHLVFLRELDKCQFINIHQMVVNHAHPTSANLRLATYPNVK